MTSRILITLAAAAIGVGLFVGPAAAREWQDRDYWWEKSANTGCGYADEYDYPGISACGCGCGGGYGRHGHQRRHARFRSAGYEDDGYGRSHRGRDRHRGDRHRGEWRYDREHHDWRR